MRNNILQKIFLLEEDSFDPLPPRKRRSVFAHLLPRTQRVSSLSGLPGSHLWTRGEPVVVIFDEYSGLLKSLKIVCDGVRNIAAKAPNAKFYGAQYTSYARLQNFVVRRSGGGSGEPHASILCNEEHARLERYVGRVQPACRGCRILKNSALSARRKAIKPQTPSQPNRAH
jgi:hypothetical protein